eukprot:TRINITY_DN5817_c0_g1_i1.p1 TRINITY_DN5817_c0_g1~~TRINITY_DN5817_c0_g1_i1.p1  ORF type:complete len:139 (+),score=21.87 TRINITY_DN5817_c0_g1_i1:64-480(+)
MCIRDRNDELLLQNVTSDHLNEKIIQRLNTLDDVILEVFNERLGKLSFEVEEKKLNVKLVRFQEEMLRQIQLVKGQVQNRQKHFETQQSQFQSKSNTHERKLTSNFACVDKGLEKLKKSVTKELQNCLLYTSPSPRDS